MKNQRFVIAAVTVALVLGQGSDEALALQPPHDASNTITCSNCHFPHPSSSALISRDATQDVMCRSCHNPTGQASTMSDIAMHVVNTGTTIVDCGSCHDPHGPQTTTNVHPPGSTAPNRFLVRGNTAKYVPAALEPAIYQVDTVDFAFGTGVGAPYNAICQTCHTSTVHHTNTGAPDNDHMAGLDCTSCHRHADGFLPQSCVGCHASPQDNGDGIPPGGRRAVVGEFPGGTVHAHLQGNPVSDADCQVCHDVTTHQNGSVELIDPDSGALYTFVNWTDLGSSPDVSDFCANCHDANGAQRLATPMDPFGGGNAPADMKSRFQGTVSLWEWYGDSCFGNEGTGRFVNSHHDISDADQANSGAKLECLNCHGAHTSADTQKLTDPDSPLTPWAGTVSNHCLACHDGGAGPGAPGMPTDVIAPMIDVDANGMPCNIPGNTCGVSQTNVSGLRPLNSCSYQNAPWWVQYNFAGMAHFGDSKRGWPGYSGAPGAVMECTTCHDPHGSYSAGNPAGNPYIIRDFVDGSSLVDDGDRFSGWNGPPWNTMGQSRAVVLTVTPGASPPPGGADPYTINWGGATGLCEACHVNWQASDFWHSTCGACQTCHGHGQVWGNADWVGQDDDTPCP
ncbi:MAG: hypothetical protein ABI333_01610 [bacterium]